jgi:hypothetical protein
MHAWVAHDQRTQPSISGCVLHRTLQHVLHLRRKKVELREGSRKRVSRGNMQQDRVRKKQETIPAVFGPAIPSHIVPTHALFTHKQNALGLWPRRAYLVMHAPRTHEATET